MQSRSADYTDCRSWKVLGVPGHQVVRLEEIDELDGLRKDVSRHQDQPVQGVCRLFECHWSGGSWGHGSAGVGGERSAHSPRLIRIRDTASASPLRRFVVVTAVVSVNKNGRTGFKNMFLI